MKRICNIALLSALALVAAVSCRKTNEQAIEWRTELQVVSSDLVFAPVGGSGTAVLNLSGANVTSNASWCQASVSGETVSVTVDEWGGLESRYAKLTASRGGESLDISVIQYGVNMGGVAIEPEVTAYAQGGTFSFPCATNAMVRASSSADWLTVSLDGDVLKLDLTANPDKATRVATVSIDVGDIVREVTVIQFPAFENTPDWVVTYSGIQVYSGKQYATLTNTVSADHGLYLLTLATPAEFASSGLSEADFVRGLALDYRAAILEAIEYYAAQGYDYTFADFLLTGTDFDYFSLLEDGDYFGYAIGFDGRGYPTGWYTADLFEVGGLTPYQKWLGNWSVPRGDGADTWIVAQNVENESFLVSGIAGFDADRNAPGAFVAVVPYDPETNEMVFKVYENTEVMWEDSSRGVMNALLSGQYTNVQGKTYYNSGVGNTICRAAMSEDGATAQLTPRSVTSAGEPAFFYNIRWYGRYTTSSGSRSGVSWTGMETALPNVMTKQQ
jgi:hypothetical protein